MPYISIFLATVITILLFISFTERKGRKSDLVMSLVIYVSFYVVSYLMVKSFSLNFENFNLLLISEWLFFAIWFFLSAYQVFRGFKTNNVMLFFLFLLLIISYIIFISLNPNNLLGVNLLISLTPSIVLSFLVIRTVGTNEAIITQGLINVVYTANQEIENSPGRFYLKLWFLYKIAKIYLTSLKIEFDFDEKGKPIIATNTNEGIPINIFCTFEFQITNPFLFFNKLWKGNWNETLDYTKILFAKIIESYLELIISGDKNEGNPGFSIKDIDGLKTQISNLVIAYIKEISNNNFATKGVSFVDLYITEFSGPGIAGIRDNANKINDQEMLQKLIKAKEKAELAEIDKELTIEKERIEKEKTIARKTALLNDLIARAENARLVGDAKNKADALIQELKGVAEQIRIEGGANQIAIIGKTIDALEKIGLKEAEKWQKTNIQSLFGENSGGNNNFIDALGKAVAMIKTFPENLGTNQTKPTQIGKEEPAPTTKVSDPEKKQTKNDKK